MGLIGSYMRLGRMADDIQAQSDVKGDLASMKSQMDAMKTSMAAANAAQATASAPLKGAHRVSATATVIAARPANTWVQGSRLVDIDLTVSLPGGIMIPATQSALVAPQNEFALRPGIQLAVTIDPAVPSSVAISW